MLGVGKIFLVIVSIYANSPKRDKDVLILFLSINGNNGLYKTLKKKIEKLRLKNYEFFILMALAESEPNS